MKKITKYICLTYTIFNICPVFADNTTENEIQAYANLENIFDSQIKSHLNFGNIFIRPNNEKGIVILRPDGLILSNNNDIKPVAHTSIPGEITVTGNPGQTINLHYSDAVLVNQSNPEATMKLSDITDVYTQNRNIYLENGSENIQMGGTLNINEKQPSGQYYGNYRVVIKY